MQAFRRLYEGFHGAVDRATVLRLTGACALAGGTIGGAGMWLRQRSFREHTVFKAACELGGPSEAPAWASSGAGGPGGPIIRGAPARESTTQLFVGSVGPRAGDPARGAAALAEWKARTERREREAREEAEARELARSFVNVTG